MKTTEITQVVDALLTTRGGDSRRRVLVAMSGASMRKLLAAEVRAAGLDVVEASEVTEALDHVARSLVDGDWRLPIDLAICDLSADPRGRLMVDAVRQADSTLAIVALAKRGAGPAVRALGLEPVTVPMAKGALRRLLKKLAPPTLPARKKRNLTARRTRVRR